GYTVGEGVAMRVLAAVVAWMLVGGPAWATGRTPTFAPTRFEPIELPRLDAPLPYTPTDEMRAWVHRRVPSNGTEDERMRRLLGALSSELPLAYDLVHTGTAPEVFATGRFNCLALTHLLVGLAREVGVDAYYVRVEEFRSFDKRGDLVLVSTHVAAGWGSSAQIQVIELQPPSEREGRAAERITDEQALALHYTNRGAELLQLGAPGPARDWLLAAVAFDPSASEAWVNLGVAERRLGSVERAEAAYRQAIEVDPDDRSAWRNLASLLDRAGEVDAARQMLALLDRRGNANPYTYLALGDLSLDSHDLDDAARYYRRAYHRAPREAEIRAARGSLALAQHRSGAARRWLARAGRIDAADPRVIALSAAVGVGDVTSL
ncbi:MAG: tetratricopeptide repeat protein, partial [Myxococcota bacterium]